MSLNIHTDLPFDERTLIMGIVNVTPDSFSDGGKFINPADAIDHAIHLVEDGADILDIGAESTRPGAADVSVEEEIDRLLPVVNALVKSVDVPISVDTTKSVIAQQMLDAGAHIINDISGLQFDPQLSKVVADYGCPVVIMHIQGTPRTMQKNPVYNDVISDIISYFKKRVEFARSAGIQDQQIILDPGIGFGKTIEHNFRILSEFREFTSLGYPLVLGASRKSFIGKTLDVPVDDRLEGSLAAAVVGAWNGANIIRVHDVKETKRALRITDAIDRQRGDVS